LNEKIRSGGTIEDTLPKSYVETKINEVLKVESIDDIKCKISDDYKEKNISEKAPLLFELATSILNRLHS
jgi:hypothetical protein